MATLNSFIRSAAAAGRRAERAHQQRTREAARQYKIQQKEEAVKDAYAAVREYNEYLEVLKSVHKDVSDPIDWQALLKEPEPQEPLFTNQHEKQAAAALMAYKPSFFDKVFGSSRKKAEKLGRQLESAKQIDLADYNRALQKHQEALAEQKALKKIAAGILENDIQSYKEAMDFFTPFSEISELGSKLGLELTAHNATLDLHVNSASIIPDYTLSTTSTGKLSKKNMPVTRFNEYYQDYVCSCILRVARETFAYLPVSLVVVNARGDIYNPATGITKEEVIVSVAISPDILEGLNFELIDPSDSMRNFPHQMKFGKTTGFSPVQKMEAANLIK